MIKTLVHVHTDYSFDSNISPECLAAFADREGFGCIAVTDHDTIEGALRLRSMTRANVVIGEEITTSQGHLIGLFLKECIQPGMSARATAEAIKAQGGLVLLPHPFVAAFGCGLRNVSYEIADLLDAVEINNAQNLLPGPDRQAAEFAKQLGIPAYVGADTHDRNSIAPCYQTMAEFSGPQSFLNSLHEAALVPGRHPLSYFAATAIRLAQFYTGLGLPTGFGANAVAAMRTTQAAYA